MQQALRRCNGRRVQARPRALRGRRTDVFSKWQLPPASALHCHLRLTAWWTVNPTEVG